MKLTNPEIHKVRAFVEDQFMSETVKKVLLSVTEGDYPELAEQIPTNDVLGAKIRAMAEGKKFIQEGFDKLLEFQKVEEHKVKVNPGI